MGWNLGGGASGPLNDENPSSVAGALTSTSHPPQQGTDFFLAAHGDAPSPPPPRVSGPRLDLTKKGAGLYLRLSLAIEILNTRLVTFYDVRG